MELELIEEKSDTCNTNILQTGGSPLIGIAIVVGFVVVVAIGIKYFKDKSDAKTSISTTLTPVETKQIEIKTGVDIPQGVI